MAKNKSKNVEDQVTNDEVTFEEVEDGQTAGEEKEGFFAKNLVYIIAAAVILLGIFLYQRYGNSEGVSEDEKVAAGQLAGAEYNFQRDSLRNAIEGDPQFSGFLAVVEDNDGTKSANLAKYYLGIAELKQGNYAQGIEYLEEYEKGENMVSAAAHAAMGYGYAQQGNYNEAAEQYEIASRTPEENQFTTPYYLMDAARNYEAAGNTSQALEIYKRIRDDYPRSDDVRNGLVIKLIAKLEAGA